MRCYVVRALTLASLIALLMVPLGNGSGVSVASAASFEIVVAGDDAAGTVANGRGDGDDDGDGDDSDDSDDDSDGDDDGDGDGGDGDGDGVGGGGGDGDGGGGGGGDDDGDGDGDDDGDGDGGGSGDDDGDDDGGDGDGDGDAGKDGNGRPSGGAEPEKAHAPPADDLPSDPVADDIPSAPVADSGAGVDVVTVPALTGTGVASTPEPLGVAEVPATPVPVDSIVDNGTRSTGSPGFLSSAGLPIGLALGALAGLLLLFLALAKRRRNRLARPGLTPEQQAQLPGLLTKAAEAFGFQPRNTP